MRATMWRTGALIAVLAIVLGACNSTGATTSPAASVASEAPAASETAAPAESTAPSEAAVESATCEGATPNEFFDLEECNKQLRLRSVTPEGPEGQPWLQYLEPDFVDTAKWKHDGPAKVCFSNASISNPWRVTGHITMLQTVEQQKAAGKISEFVEIDAGGDDNKQISDISQLLSQGCDALIISPNTTAALTPAVEQACATGIPVIDFDRGVNTDCPVTFIKSIGGYAYGADGAEFLAANVKKGGNIISIRILPGVDVLETRWLAAEAIFKQAGLNVVSSQFTQGDPAETKKIVADALEQGAIDGVWMDAGATSVGAIEAFEDAGLPVPPIAGEDQQDFLMKWQDENLTAIAPNYSNFMWRTAVMATVMILNGEQVPAHWNLPQPAITQATLAQSIDRTLPPLHYASCGCSDLPGYPDAWKNR
jgi:ribose transport system substrate-binding protein